ncbi:MAG: ABC transporter ATP-binding protein [Anaerolineae bacterium]
MLKLDDVTAGYGPITALRHVSLAVQPGEVVALLGANGAGKTTLLRTISGLVRPSTGTVAYNGRQIDRIPPDRIVALGLAHVPEGRQIFPELTVAENLRLGAYRRRDRAQVKHDLARALDIFPILQERYSQPGGTLSGGEQQMLAIARALMAAPRLLLLDEPSMGLAPLIVQRIFAVIAQIHAEGVTVLMAEQNARMALAAANRAYVLQSGTIRLHGPTAELRHNPEVQHLYLGVS